MSRTFALLDHKCPPLEKLLEEKKVSYEWFVCGCSPIERQYQILEEGEWKNIDKCPFCGVSMTGKSDEGNVIYARKPPLGFQIAEGYSHSINLDVVDEFIDVNPREAMRLMNIALKMLAGNHPPFEPRYQK